MGCRRARPAVAGSPDGLSGRLAAVWAMDDPHEQRAIPSKVASAAKLLLRSATGLSLKLGLLSALVVALVVGAGAAWAYVRQRDRLIASTRQAAETQARLTLTGLQFAMLENNR